MSNAEVIVFVPTEPTEVPKGVETYVETVGGGNSGNMVGYVFPEKVVRKFAFF